MEIKRKEFKLLSDWYNSLLRKTPCILFGARQVGKSTLAANFAKSTGRKIFTVNFWKDTDRVYPKIFSKNASAEDVLRKLELVFQSPIDPENAILLLDEIQECPAVYSLFKTFKEDTELPVIATGSYLKLFLANQSDVQIPVGCTQEYSVTPITFSDFLLNRNKTLHEFYQSCPLSEVVDSFYHKALIEVYHEYLFTGGMPEVVATYLDTFAAQGALIAADLSRRIQQQILSSYRNDFLTFNQNKFVIGRDIVSKLAYAFATIPKELSKYREFDQPVGRFRFTALGENASFKRVSNVFDYLSLAGLIIKSHVVKKPQVPLINESEEKNAFKCFYFDVGMLQAALDIPYQDILADELSGYKGPIAENFVAQQLFSSKQSDLVSWKERNGHEVEFLYPGRNLIPIEVKASKRPQPTKSLQDYVRKYQPPFAIKIAPRNFGQTGKIISLPIYFIERVKDLIDGNSPTR